MRAGDKGPTIGEEMISARQWQIKEKGDLDADFALCFLRWANSESFALFTENGLTFSPRGPFVALSLIGAACCDLAIARLNIEKITMQSCAKEGFDAGKQTKKKRKNLLTHNPIV